MLGNICFDSRWFGRVLPFLFFIFLIKKNYLRFKYNLKKKSIGQKLIQLKFKFRGKNAFFPQNNTI